MLSLQYDAGGVFLPKLNLWLDPHHPKTGPERVFISHAHSDHIGLHREVILSAPTARLMHARLPGERHEHLLAFHQPAEFGNEDSAFRITLLPAGHIFGSAMALIESAGHSLLYTGDFKLRPGMSAEVCEPRPADILIMETTYGRPQYQFPPTDAVMRGIIRFCQQALDNDETAVLLGYSLGKSQELLCGLGDAGLPIMLHGTVYKLTKIYEQFGQCFPKYERYEAGAATGKVLLCPPNVVNSAMLRNLGRVRTAVLTGWAVDPNCRYRYQADAAFPLSDHADFPDLIEFVKRVAPRKVYTLHGFAADFAQTLRTLGFEAHALSQQEQMSLAMDSVQLGKRVTSKPPLPNISAPPAESSLKVCSFMSFAETAASIALTSSKLEKVRLLGEYFRKLDAESLSRTAVWFTGLPFAATENKVLQIGWALLRDVLCAASGIEEAELHQVYLKHSDLGETAFDILAARGHEASGLSIPRVASLFEQLYAARGSLAKLPLLLEAVRQASALEAKYLVKVITSDLRIGLKEGLVEEALANAFGISADEVRQANLLLGHIGETARLAIQGRLHTAGLVAFRPLKFMLASPEETPADIWKRLTAADAPIANNVPAAAEAGANLSSTDSRMERPEPVVWVEDKYDGIRCQLHKVGNRVALYSRDLKDITSTFLDLADGARHLPADLILDGEILAMRNDDVLPFAELQRRLGRREGDLFMGVEVPIKFVAFDLLWLDGGSLLNFPLRLRRQRLESIASWPEIFRLARITQARSIDEIEAAFAAARERNNEGLMIKDPLSTYIPGRRGLAWLKLKRAFATLDCVVVGAEYGHGKRKAVLSDYTFAVRDEVTGELKTIGKAYSGLTDMEISQLTKHFLSKVVRQHGRYHEVKPDTVLEIAFDRLQLSSRHTSGIAMRFPRILRIRADKSVAEIDTVASAKRLLK